MVHRVQFVDNRLQQGPRDFTNLLDRRPQQGLFGQLTSTLLSFVFDRNPQERPIGISQISPKTFQAADPKSDSVFFKNNRTYQDFRFNKLTPFQPGLGNSQPLQQ